MKVGTTMYIGKQWYCKECGQLMECLGIGEHEEVGDS